MNLQETIKKLQDCPDCIKAKHEALRKLFPYVKEYQEETKDELE